MRWILVLLMTLAGCADRAAAPADPIRADCGAFQLGPGEVLPADAAGCLLDAARQNRAAVLRVTRPTVEGALIPVTYASRADGRIDVTIDSRNDPWGEQVLSRVTCAVAAYHAQDGITVRECGEPLRVEE